jgi:hypothetical protein
VPKPVNALFEIVLKADCARHFCSFGGVAKKLVSTNF